jgi:hypothetical protein
MFSALSVDAKSQDPLRSGGDPFAVSQHFADRRREVIHTSARHNDRVSVAVRLFGDTQKFSALILPKLDVKKLALDLDLYGLDDVIHGKPGAILSVLRFGLEAYFILPLFQVVLRENVLSSLNREAAVNAGIALAFPHRRL